MFRATLISIFIFSLGLLAVNGLARPMKLRPGLAQRQPSQTWPVIKGFGGQVDLALDQQPLNKKHLSLRPLNPNHSQRLNTLEKARRYAASLAASPEKQQQRVADVLIGVVRQRLPVRGNFVAAKDGQQREFRLLRRDRRGYQRFNHKMNARKGPCPLSVFWQKKIGLCRERAESIRSLFAAANISAVTRYGLIYDRQGRYLDDHVWVEALVSGRWRLVDPSVTSKMQPLEQGSFTESVPSAITPSGRVEQTVTASFTDRFIYVPLKDDKILRQAVKPW